MNAWTSEIEDSRRRLDEVIAEQYRYPREVLGKTRRLHPDELLRYTPIDLIERENDARADLYYRLLNRDIGRVKSSTRSRYVPDRSEVRALLLDARAKSRWYEELKALGTEFVLMSEIVEAKVGADIAWRLVFIALDKNHTKVVARCRPPKRRTVTDGYRSTNRYRVVDGVRIPIVKRIRVPEH